jgi:hypothetical protein
MVLVDYPQVPVTTWCEVSGGRIVEATVKAIVDNRWHPFQVSLGNETALIYLWQVAEEGR